MTMLVALRRPRVLVNRPLLQQHLRFSALPPPPPQHVTAPAFASLVHKTGLSVKTLRDLDTAAQEATAQGGDGAFPIAVALSGGADSMALTLLLREHLRLQQIRTPLLAITVDHRLRPESAQEAADVGRMVTERWGVVHVVTECEWASESPLDTAAGAGGVNERPTKPRMSKVQEEARRYRYALLQQVCREKRVQCLFVAHNLGDQLETMLFRLGRASGINGLAGIARVSTLMGSLSGGDTADGSSPSIDDVSSRVGSSLDRGSVRLVRPLLSISKVQLKETCRHFGQEWVEDPSNDKLLFDRIRIRKVRLSLVRLLVLADRQYIGCREACKAQWTAVSVC